MTDATQVDAPADDAASTPLPTQRPGVDEIIANHRKALEAEGIDMEALQAAPDEEAKPIDGDIDESAKTVTTEPARSDDSPPSPTETKTEAKQPSDGAPEAPATPDAEPPTKEGDKPTEARPSDAGDAGDADGEELVEVNVLGQIEMVSRKELARGYQTGRASNVRFEEAKRLRDEANATLAEAKRLRGDGQAPPMDAPDKWTDDADAAVVARKEAKQRLGDALNQVRFGDDAEFAKAVQIIDDRLNEGRGPAATPDDDKIVEDVIAKVLPAVQHHTQVTEEMRKLNDDYGDLLQDADLMAVTVNRTHAVRYEDLLGIGYTAEQLNEATRAEGGLGNLIALHQQFQAEGKVRPEAAVLREACVRTKTWSDDLRGASSQPDPGSPDPTPANSGNGAARPGSDGLATRAARKETMPQHPRPSAAATTDDLGGAEKPPPKATDIVAAMKAARPGQ